MIRPPPRPPLFPYPPLFRSHCRPPSVREGGPPRRASAIDAIGRSAPIPPRRTSEHGICADPRFPRSRARKSRSEEHTSELQSQSNLVCRLLLEKKKNYLSIRPSDAERLIPQSGPVFLPIALVLPRRPQC